MATTSPSATRARFSKLSKAVRTARQAATDYASENRPLSPEQTAEHRRLVALADAAQDAVDAFYEANRKSAGGALRC